MYVFSLTDASDLKFRQLKEGNFLEKLPQNAVFFVQISLNWRVYAIILMYAKIYTYIALGL